MFDFHADESAKGQVPDFGGQFFDTDPNFGQHWHFCGTMTEIRTDKTHIKWLPIYSSDKDVFIIIGCILKVITVKLKMISALFRDLVSTTPT